MQQKILNILLTITLISIIYISNFQIQLSLFLLIIFSTLNKNYYSYLSIIPLIFINTNLFFVFMLLEFILFIISFKIDNKMLKNSSTILIIFLYYLYLILIQKIPITFIPLLSLSILPAIILDTFGKTENKVYITELLVLSISIININHINPYLFLSLYLLTTILLSLSKEKPYYIITSFFIMCYSLYITKNFIFLFIQIIAYLSYFFKNIIKKEHTIDGLEFLIDDINQNVSNFLSFTTNFLDTNTNKKYDEKLSTSIKILIENYCTKCRNRHICFADKKMETYIFLKRILTTKELVNFKCIYYQDIIDKAITLNKEYKLYDDVNLIDFKLENICYSIQNYFLSLFEKTTPKILFILNFKKVLIEKNVKFTNFTHNILNDDKFQLKIFAKKIQILNEIKSLALSYFDTNKVQIKLAETYIIISPKKVYKVIYEYATLSHNNCQISGDNFLFKHTHDSNFICALSDGMGSGYSAYQLSQQTLKMVDKITDCSIDFETSLEILNNFFKTKDALDSYATLDFVDINLSTGKLNLYKMGSSTTFILRDNKVVPIYNNNLPFGVSDLIIKEEYELKNDDLIILVSDGVTDYINEEKLINYIEKLKNESPHKIVYDILQKIYYENGNQIKDDMSCVVLKLKPSLN